SSGPWVAWVLLAALVVFALQRALRADAIPLFGLYWFLVALGPYLPLGGHLSDYYLFFPAAGLALAGGVALDAAWRAGWLHRAVAVGLLALFLSGSLRYSESIVDYSYRTSIRCRNLITGLRYARERHPDKTILLASIDDVFFYASIYHNLFRLSGV